jgi:hypothetical protein
VIDLRGDGELCPVVAEAMCEPAPVTILAKTRT